MSGFFTLLILSMVMAIASFLAGILPLSISLSRTQLRLISTVGMGVLVGTSLIVIIPEGVETIYTSNEASHGHVRRYIIPHLHEVQSAHPALAVRTSPFLLEIRDGIDTTPSTEVFDLPGPVIPESFDVPPKTPTDPGIVGILGSEVSNGESEAGEIEDNEEAHHAWIGVALILGFILMFLIDKLPQLTSTPKPVVKTHNIALNNIGRRFNLSSSPNQDEEESEGFLDPTSVPEPPRRGFATTIGLVIHAFSDGIALGASSSTSHTKLSLIIFFAIMLHKAPAAFGLTSILLRQGFSKRTVRTHLIVFSLAAPLGALVTWMAARVLGAGAAHNASDTKWWTGVLLLFSAGTFLYVAMHSMQEVLNGHHDKHSLSGHANGSLERRDSNVDPQQDDHKPSIQDLGAALFGMILPLFLQVGHAH